MRYFLFLLMVTVGLALAESSHAQLWSDVEEIDQISIQDFRYNSSSSTFGMVNTSTDGSSGFLGTIAERPGLALLSSAIIPGLGQAANGQWWKTAIFAGIEIGAIALMIERRNHAQKVERQYNQMADENWSVVQYTQFLIEYSNLDLRIEDFLTPEGMERFLNDGFINPAFNNDIDWATINLSALNEAEAATIYRSTGMFFSHVVPAYGSQQYYELVSKYFQYGPGWIDWNGDISIVDGGIEDMSEMWREHARIESEFNEAYRFSNNMIMVLLVNHVFSAFDAFITSRLRLHRNAIQSEAILHGSGLGFNLKVGF